MKFPIRTEIEVLPADPPGLIVGVHDQIIITSSGKVIEVGPVGQPRRLILGWTIKETIGVAVVNTRGVSQGRKSVVIGK